MDSLQEFVNKVTGEKVYYTQLINGLKVYVCPKKGYSKQIGMFGTIYGSIDTDYVDITTGRRTKVPEGIAHFLEHKLFEQEGGNALDLFSKMGVSSNAYTSLDHTVYFFETNKNFDDCLKTLFSFVSTPYFTNENVEKEKGIISQELKMYDDDPNAVVYYTTLKGMYSNLPLKHDIGGTQESIKEITKEMLYSSYHTFYNPQNMFCIIIADTIPEQMIRQIEKTIAQYLVNINRNGAIPVRYLEQEAEKVAIERQEKKLGVSLPQIAMGFKQEMATGEENIKNSLMIDIVNEACFSELSSFYEQLKNENILTAPLEMAYEAGRSFAHILVMGASQKIEELEKKTIEYISELRENGIDKEMFDMVVKKKMGEMIYMVEQPMQIHREIIDSIIQKQDVYLEASLLDTITKEEIDLYIKKAIDINNMTTTTVT